MPIDFTNFPDLFANSTDVSARRVELESCSKDFGTEKSFQSLDELPSNFKGRFKVYYSGIWFHFLSFPNSKSDQIIFSFSSGDRSKVKGDNLFIRWKYHKYFSASFVCIDTPMHDLYPNLQDKTPSWYFGTDKIDLCRIVANLLVDISSRWGKKDITLLGSSAGGYAASLVGTYIENAKVIAISPQFIISNWHESPAFIDETGIDLKTNPRNNICKLIRLAKSSRFLFFFNQKSKRDIETQLKPFAKVNNIKLKYGLNFLENIGIWLHNTEGISYHSSGIVKLEVLFAYWLIHQNPIDLSVHELNSLIVFLNEYINQKATYEKKILTMQEGTISKNEKITREIHFPMKSTENDKDNNDFNNLYLQKKYDTIVESFSSKISCDDLFYYGMSLYRTRQFNKALSAFSFLEQIDYNNEKFRPSLLGYTYFKLGDYLNSEKYFKEQIESSKYDSNVLVNYLISRLLSRGQLDQELLSKLESKEKGNALLKLIDFLNARNLSFEGFFDVIFDQFYSIKHKTGRVRSETLYIMIHPIILGHGLFENRRFECDSLFIEQKLIYAYFMVFTDQLIAKINKIINDYAYKQIVFLGTSASGFISLVLSSKLADLNPKINFLVHSFSPQVEINQNTLLNEVYHYKCLLSYSKFDFIKENVQEYGSVPKLLSKDVKNLVIEYYYGDKDKIDALEARKLAKLRFSYLHEHSIPGFPFHQSFFLYRYNDKLFLENRRNMYASPGVGVVEPTITSEELIDIKHKYGGSMDQILPLMRSKNS